MCGVARCVEGVANRRKAKSFIDLFELSFSFPPVNSSIDIVHLYFLFFLFLFVHFPLVLLPHLTFQFVVVNSRLEGLRFNEDTFKHAIFKFANTFLVVDIFLTFSSLELRHLLLNDLLVLLKVSFSLVVLISIVAVEEVMAIVGISKTFQLIPVVVIFLLKSLMFFIEVHILLMLSFDLLVIFDTIEIPLFDSIAVPFILKSFNLVDLILN